MIQHQYIAIDIGKASLDARNAEQACRLPNDLAGWRKIAALAAKLTNALVVCEASGGYERDLLRFLEKAGVAFRLVNPARIRGYAASEGIKAKTDPIDAAVIYGFACEKELQAMEPPTREQRELGDLLDRRAQITDSIAREKNHLEKAPKLIAASAQRTLRFLAAELAKIEKLIRALVASQSAMRAQLDILLSVDGVGEVTAWSILAYLREITSLPRNQLVALAGLAPFNRDSGTTCAKRRICGGRAKVRRCLYMAAHSAATHNPVISAYVRRLRQRGKPYKCAIVAAMRKLLIHLQSLLRASTQIPLAA